MVETQGQLKKEIRGTDGDPKDAAQDRDASSASQRSTEVKSAVPKGANQWSSYPQDQLASPGSSPGRPQRQQAGGQEDRRQGRREDRRQGQLETGLEAQSSLGISGAALGAAPLFESRHP